MVLSTKNTIAQIIFTAAHIPEFDDVPFFADLAVTSKQTGGFGSTGIK